MAADSLMPAATLAYVMETGPVLAWRFRLKCSDLN